MLLSTRRLAYRVVWPTKLGLGRFDFVRDVGKDSPLQQERANVRGVTLEQIKSQICICQYKVLLRVAGNDDPRPVSHLQDVHQAAPRRRRRGSPGLENTSHGPKSGRLRGPPPPRGGPATAQWRSLNHARSAAHCRPSASQGRSSPRSGVPSLRPGCHGHGECEASAGRFPDAVLRKTPSNAAPRRNSRL